MTIQESLIRRLDRLQRINADPGLARIENALCRADPVHWCNSWCWTYDPKNVSSGLPPYIPFDLFPRQEELLRWVLQRVAASEEGLVEKSRDIGWTWLSAAFAVNRWLYVPGFKTTFGSRKEAYVDQLGNPDSIFGKIRLLLDRLPPWMLPPGFDRARHDNYLKIINPYNDNVISAEAGSNMGRGGRSSLYVVDEGAYIEHAETVDAAIVANADCRIWASSVNGPGNLFYRKRHSGNIAVFRFHWRDDPRKTEEWARKRRSEVEEFIWAAEYDIDYSASVEGLCIPAKWIASARRLSELVAVPAAPSGVAGLDVGAGRAKSVFVARFGPLVKMPAVRQDGDTTDTAFWALDQAEAAGVLHLYYDSVGVGQGVVSILSKNERKGIKAHPTNTGQPPSEVMWPDGRTSKEWFLNTRAEVWWTMRERFKKTHEHVLFLDNDGGKEHPLDELIALPEDAALVGQLSAPKWFRNESGKILLEKKSDMARRGIASPDQADALALTFYPAPQTPGLLGFFAEEYKRLDKPAAGPVAAALPACG